MTASMIASDGGEVAAAASGLHQRIEERLRVGAGLIRARIAAHTDGGGSAAGTVSANPASCADQRSTCRANRVCAINRSKCRRRDAPLRDPSEYSGRRRSCRGRLSYLMADRDSVSVPSIPCIHVLTVPSASIKHSLRPRHARLESKTAQSPRSPRCRKALQAALERPRVSQAPRGFVVSALELSDSHASRFSRLRTRRSHGNAARRATCRARGCA